MKEKKIRNKGSWSVRLPNRKVVRFKYAEDYQAFTAFYSRLRCPWVEFYPRIEKFLHGGISLHNNEQLSNTVLS